MSILCDEKAESKKEKKRTQVVVERHCRQRAGEGLEFSIKIPETELRGLQIFEFKTYKMGQNLIFCMAQKFREIHSGLISKFNCHEIRNK